MAEHGNQEASQPWIAADAVPIQHSLIVIFKCSNFFFQYVDNVIFPPEAKIIVFHYLSKYIFALDILESECILMTSGGRAPSETA